MSHSRPSACGYLSPDYGNSFSSLGMPIILPQSGIQLLQRKINSEFNDLVGVYPLSFCRQWDLLEDDISQLDMSKTVSLVFIADPFSEAQVIRTCKDWKVCRPFKTHIYIDIASDWRALRSMNTRNYANRGLRLQHVDVCPASDTHTDLFWSLYSQSIERHGMGEMQAMSKDIITQQLRVPGAIMSIAHNETGVHGAMITYHHGDVAYLHLMGLSPTAYKLSTSYALFHQTIEHLEKLGCKKVNIGGASGGTDDPNDSLYKFKKRWSDNKNHAYICGKILNIEASNELSKKTSSVSSNYFPAYRKSF